MKPIFSSRAVESYQEVSLEVRKAFDKQLRLLLSDLRHPSLHAKKYDESKGIWQARVNRVWRFYFTIESDIYYIHDIIPHPK